MTKGWTKSSSAVRKTGYSCWSLATCQDKCQGEFSCSSHSILAGRQGRDGVVSGAMSKRGSVLAMAHTPPLFNPHVASGPDLPTKVC